MSTMIFRLVAVCLMALTLAEAYYQDQTGVMINPQRNTSPCNNRVYTRYFNRNCNSHAQYRIRITAYNCKNLIAYYCQYQQINLKTNSNCELVKQACASIATNQKPVIPVTPKVTTSKPSVSVTPKIEINTFYSKPPTATPSTPSEIIPPAIDTSETDFNNYDNIFGFGQNVKTTEAPKPVVDETNEHYDNYDYGFDETKSEEPPKESEEITLPNIQPGSDVVTDIPASTLPQNRPAPEFHPPPYMTEPAAPAPNYNRVIYPYPEVYSPSSPCQVDSGSTPCQNPCMPTDPCAQQYIDPNSEIINANFAPAWQNNNGYNQFQTYYPYYNQFYQ